MTQSGECIYTDRAFYRLPILADAIEDAGCHDALRASHCNSQALACHLYYGIRGGAKAHLALAATTV